MFTSNVEHIVNKMYCIYTFVCASSKNTALTSACKSASCMMLESTHRGRKRNAGWLPPMDPACTPLTLLCSDNITYGSCTAPPRDRKQGSYARCLFPRHHPSSTRKQSPSSPQIFFHSLWPYCVCDNASNQGVG
jgi:hypothetical protein